MTTKDKIKVFLLTIFTLGFCWLHWWRVNKHQQALVQGTKSTSVSEGKFNELIELLGGIENVVSMQASGSKLNVKINNAKLVNQQAILDSKIASGALISSEKVSLICGVYSQAYVDKFNK
ncbi:PTS transporter subunit EIIB [Mycoplasmopsis mucosicanis]|nr:PTS transporter subunit EIIB [Mycoplasmopsis mucosicanis]